MNGLDDLVSTASSDNWDGFGARGLTAEVAANARAIMRAWAVLENSPFEMDATPNGTVSLNWEGDNFRAALEIGKTRMSFYFDEGGKRLFVNSELKTANGGSKSEST